MAFVNCDDCKDNCLSGSTYIICGGDGEYIKSVCNRCKPEVSDRETALLNNMSDEECSMCNKPNKLSEIQCYGKCKKIMDVCLDCHNKIMVDYSHNGLGIYEVCNECIDDYHSESTD